ncbi:MAG: Peptidase inhibitor, partial [Actinomycetota bacterium]
MRRNFRLLLGSVVVLSSLTVVTAAAAGAAQAAKGSRSGWVVTFRSGANPKAEAEQERVKGVKVTHVFEHAMKGMSVQLTAREAAALATDPMVASVEPDIT